MKISVSSYSFSKALRAGQLTWEELPEAAHKIGFDAIEFVDLPGDTQADKLALAARLKRAADERGMVINAYTIGANLFKETKEEADAEVLRLTRQLEVAEALGASVMRHDVVSALTGEGLGRSFDMMLPILAENARRVADEGQKRGIKTCSENHGRIAQDSDRVERLFNAVAHPNYGLLVDIGNFACVDEDNALAVSRVAPYAVHVHAKDFHIYDYERGPIAGASKTRGGRWLVGCAVGDGDVPVRRCIDILRLAGYQGYFSVEFEGRGDCIDGITRGYNFLSSIG